MRANREKGNAWITLVVFLLAASGMYAPPVAAHNAYRDTCYSIGASAGYAYNIIYAHHGVFDVDAFMPLNPHFEGEVHLHATTANTYVVGIQAQPKFPIQREGKDCGEIFVETRLMYELFQRNRIHGLGASFSVGYRWEYVYAKVGYGLRLASMMDISPHSTDNGILEPHNLVYHVEVFVRPHTSPWNLSFCVTDMTNSQMERMFTPIFIVNSYVDLSPHWRLEMSGRCKPVGIANMAPSFFGAEGKIGARYRF